MATTANIYGLEEVKAKLDDLPRKLQSKILNESLKLGAEVIKSACRPPVRTGLTAANLKIRGGSLPKKGKVKVTLGIGAKDYTGKAFYAAFLLYGHRVGSRRLGDKRKLVPANNWLERAFKSSAEKATATACNAIVQGIEKWSSE